MLKRSLLAVVGCLPLALFAQKGFTVKGKVGELNAPAMVYLTYKNDTTIVKDSAVLKKGQFTFKGKLSVPVADASLVVKHDTITRPKGTKMDYLRFYLENSNITVTAADSINNAVVKGSVAMEEEKALGLMQAPYKTIADSVTKAYYAKTAEERKDTVWSKALGKRMRESQAGYDSVTRIFVVKHPNSFIALRAFINLEVGYSFNPDTAAARFAKFTPAVRTSPTGKKVEAMIEKGKMLSVGKMALDFTETDTAGNKVKLSDFRGKYVLLDFWASWCKPCRAENPNVLAAYNKYKEKNFTVLGVSLDDEKGRNAWLGAVYKDGMPWTQVSELKGFQSKSAVLYGINAIPANFLIDPTGKILALNLRGEALDKKLAELFSK